LIPLKKVDHVSMAAWDLDEQVGLMERLFGMKVLGRWRSDADEYEGVNMSIPGTDIEFEVIVPTTKTSFLVKFLEERGQALHHITMEVDSIDRTVEELHKEGIEPFRGVNLEDDWKTTYIHPRDSGGVLYQLFERTDGASPK
jgi:methylmalonyl-CoA epimerase